MHRLVVLASILSLAGAASADPPLGPRVGVALTVPAPPPASVRLVAPAPRFEWAPAPQPSFGMFTASADVGGGPMTSPDGTPLSAGGWELGVNGGWGPTRFAELRLRASIFDQVDRAADANGDQQDDVDEKNLLGMFLGGGLRLRLPLYTGIDEGAATRFTLFSEGLLGYQPLFGYGDVVSSGPAFEVTNGLLISHVRRRDGLTRGLELFLRYRQGLGDGNGDLSAVLFGLGYATEWSAFVPRVPPPEPIEVEEDLSASSTFEAHGAGGGAYHEEHWSGPPEPIGRPLGFSLRMGGECGGGEGWHAAHTVGWAPWRILELQLQTSYFSKVETDEANVQGFFAGAGPRLHLYTENGLRIGVWASARMGWAQVVAAPEGRDGSGLALDLAAGVSFGGTNHPFSTTDVSIFVARQIGLTGNDDDVGMLYGGLSFDYELGPHAPPRPDPTPVVAVRPVHVPVPVPEETTVEVEHVEPEPETRTVYTIEPLRPARPWPVGFAIGAELGWSYFPRPLRGGFRDSGLGLGLGAGFVASPYLELRSRVGLLTRGSLQDSGGDDVEAMTITGGPRVRIPIRTVKDNQVALVLEVLGGWLSTADAAGSQVGGGAVLEGGIGVRLPARGGLTFGARGLLPLAAEARDLTNVQVTIGGEFEMGPRFRHPVDLPEVPRVRVPEPVEVEVRSGQ